jgi:hypothetical protein
MAFLTAAFAFIVANFGMLVGILGSILGIGAVIAKLTPSPKDDRVFAKLLGWFKLIPVPATPSPTAAPKADVEPPIMG